MIFRFRISSCRVQQRISIYLAIHLEFPFVRSRSTCTTLYIRRCTWQQFTHVLLGGDSGGVRSSVLSLFLSKVFVSVLLLAIVATVPMLRCPRMVQAECLLGGCRQRRHARRGQVYVCMYISKCVPIQTPASGFTTPSAHARAPAVAAAADGNREADAGPNFNYSRWEQIDKVVSNFQPSVDGNRKSGSKFLTLSRWEQIDKVVANY